MKIIICGPQNFTNEKLLSNVLKDYTRRNRVSTIVIGQESGTETMAAEWAMKNNIRLAVVPTDRKIKGRDAFIERNKRLVDTHKDAKAILHFVGSEVSEDLCTRSYECNIAVDDVFTHTS